MKMLRMVSNVVELNVHAGSGPIIGCWSSLHLDNGHRARLLLLAMLLWQLFLLSLLATSFRPLAHDRVLDRLCLAHREFINGFGGVITSGFRISLCGRYFRVLLFLLHPVFNMFFLFLTALRALFLRLTIDYERLEEILFTLLDGDFLRGEKFLFVQHFIAGLELHAVFAFTEIEFEELRHFKAHLLQNIEVKGDILLTQLDLLIINR